MMDVKLKGRILGYLPLNNGVPWAANLYSCLNSAGAIFTLTSRSHFSRLERRLWLVLDHVFFKRSAVIRFILWNYLFYCFALKMIELIFWINSNLLCLIMFLHLQAILVHIFVMVCVLEIMLQTQFKRRTLLETISTLIVSECIPV